MRLVTRSMALAIVALTAVGASQAQTTLTYQQGVDGYTGTFDLIIGTDLEFGDGNVLGANEPFFFLDGRYGDYFERGDEKQGLFRFDGILSDIPEGSKIVSATFELTTSTVGNAQTGGPYGVCQLIVPFDENTTYNNAGDTSLGGGEGRGDGFRFQDGETDYALANSFGGADQGETISADVTSMVQNWVDGDPNYGFVVTAGTTNGWSVCLTGNEDPALRPKLTIVYEADNPVFETSTFVQDPTDEFTSMWWVKTALETWNSDPEEWLNGDTVNPVGEYLDGDNGSSSPEDQAMLRFDAIFESDGGTVPDNAEIVSAKLVVITANYIFRDTGNVGSGGPWSARQVTSEWDPTTPFATITFDPFVSPQTALITDAKASFDITDIVKNWQAGDPNYGLNIAQNGTSDGWCILFSASPTDPPQLIIEWEEASFLPGDIDGDEDIDLTDFQIFTELLRGNSDDSWNFEAADFTGDGQITVADFNFWVEAFRNFNN